MAHIKQSRPDSGLVFKVEVLKTFQVDPSSLGSRRGNRVGARTGATGLGACSCFVWWSPAPRHRPTVGRHV